jgi:DNA-directed RNA polymerase specialized sigma24 family protein
VRKVEQYEVPAAQGGEDLDVELHEALGKLAELDREVLRLTIWEGLSHEQVGRVLDCTPNAVAIRAHRARRRLGELLDRTERSAARADMDGLNRTLPCELNPLENPA